MTSAPEFSVVTPAYQAAAFLRRCHWSLANQTIESWEWIVVDDGSTDETTGVIAALGDERIRYFRLTKNQGRGAARNFALQQTRGAWTVMLDADDFCLPQRLALAADARNAGFDFFCSAMVLINGDYRITGVREPRPDEALRQFTHGTLCGATELIRRVGYPPYRRAEDQTMVLALANTRRGFFCLEPLYVYHENAGIRLGGAIASHHYAIRQIRMLRRTGVLPRSAALNREEAARWLKLIGLAPFFLWPPAYRHTLARRARSAGGAAKLGREARAFIDECARLFPVRLSENPRAS